MSAQFALYSERVNKGLHRSAVASVDKLAGVTPTAAKNDGITGVMAASAHYYAVAPGNRYGPVVPTLGGSSITPTLNKTIDISIPPCIGAEWYDVFFSTDAQPKWLARITEAQRVAGCAITGVGTVGAGGSAGTKQVETITVTHGADRAGTIVVSVTTALLSTAALVSVALLATDDTAAEVAAKIRAALAADATVAAYFTVSGSSADVILTAILAAPNDSTLALALSSNGSTGVTVGASTDTTAGVAGTAQVETATVAGTVATAGDAKVTISTALYPSGLEILVAVAAGNNAAAVATAIRAALNADRRITDFFTVGGTSATVSLTCKTAAANDATLNIAVDNGTCTGLTAAPTSANTTAGVAPTKQVETVTVTAAATRANNLIVTVTAAGMTGSPKAVLVPVSAQLNTAAKVAATIRAYLALDASVKAFFTVGGADADIVLTAKTGAANDATMAIALTNDGATGVTVGASGDTTAGVATICNVQLVGTGLAANVAPFTVNNAYKLSNITEIDCTGHTKAYVSVKLTPADLRSVPTLSILPFYRIPASGDYAQGAVQAVTVLTAVGQSLIQVFALTLDGATGLKIAIDTLTGQGSTVDVYVELA